MLKLYREVDEAVNVDIGAESIDWDDLSTIKSSTSSLTTMTEVSNSYTVRSKVHDFSKLYKLP